MSVRFDHEKLRAYQEGLRFIAWADPILERLPGKFAARDQLDRASTSIEPRAMSKKRQRSGCERFPFPSAIFRTVVECAACLDVLVVRKKVAPQEVEAGKEILLGVVSMVAGLLARFSEQEVREGAQASYGEAHSSRENEND